MNFNWLKKRFRNADVMNPSRERTVCPADVPLIELSEVVKAFEVEAGTFYALRGVDLSVRCGEFVAVIGKSGSGKSTLINMITGIDRPTSGEVNIGGVAVHKLTENQLAMWRGRNIGVVFQFFQLLPTLSVLDNIVLPMDFCGCYDTAERPRRALELLELVGLADQAGKLPTALSGGQQQRAAIARALANDPPILLADEPTGNLDSHISEEILALLKNLNQAGQTIVMVTHDSKAASFGKRIIRLKDGSITEDISFSESAA